MDFNIWRKIQSLAATPNKTAKQVERLRKLNEEYSTGRTHYTPPLSYPTTNTRVDPLTDVLYKEKPLKDINRFQPIQIDRRYLQQYHSILPQEPFESNESYYLRLKEAFSPKSAEPRMRFNPNPTQGYFPQANERRSARSFVSLDIETDDYGHPISISALKFQRNKEGQFQAVDSYQRYYKTHSWDIRQTQSVHGFTPSNLRSLRRQQGLKYGARYNDAEMQSLQNFLGISTIVGHNILQFDLPKLFPGQPITYSTMDTLMASRSAWKNKANDLDSVFYRIFGKTMEQAGLSHHDANSDTVASMMILEAMSKNEGEVGQSIRYVLSHQGRLHLAEWDEYVNSMVTRGKYYEQFGKGKHNIGEVYMTPEELGLKKGEKWLGGMHEVDFSTSDPNRMSDAELLASALAETKQSSGGAYLGSDDLKEALNEFNNYKRATLVKELSRARSDREMTSVLRTYGYKTDGPMGKSLREMGLELRSVREKEDYAQFVLGRERKIDRFKKRNYLSEADEAVLRSTKNWDDLADAIDDVTIKNQELMKVYQTIANIKPYDVNQYIASAKKQWGGVMSASQGVVPNFLRNSIGRLGDATFNVIDRSVAPWNAFNRTWNSGIGQAVTAAGGAIGGIPGMMIGGAISGTVNAASQIYGNYKQAGMEMRMLNIQNNLNTLGAMITWISTPFQLLHKAIKLVTGAFGGLTLKLNNIMGSGIGMMSQMGNPLEPLTGVNYVDYQRAGLVDMASLLKGGSTNTAIESFAKMQRDLYRFGRVDTNKLLAANMLGVFDEAFTPTTDAEGSYYNMANKILHNMQGQNESQRADTMYYVTQLNDTLAQTIRSALMLGVSDVRQLSDPGDMYWRPLTTGEERGFRRTQREYGIATQQFGFSKMRFADRLWNAVGRDLYNGFNKVLDELGEGNWRGALDGVISMWEDLKSRFSKIWEGDEKGGGLKERLGKGLDNAWDKIKEWGIKIANGIIDVWDQIFRVILEKGQGLIAYLSTVQVGLEKDKKTGKWGISISSIKDAAWDENALLYNTDSSYSTGMIRSQTAKKGAEGFAAVIDQLFPGMSQYDKQMMTREKLAERLRHLPGYIKDGVLNTPTLDLPQYHIKGLNLGENPELIDPLLDYLMMYESSGTGMRAQAAAALSPLLKPYLDKDAYHTPLLDMYDKMVSDGRDIRLTAESVATGQDKNEATLKLELFSEGEKKGSVKYAGGKVTYEGMSPLSSVGLGKGISVKVAQVQ